VPEINYPAGRIGNVKILNGTSSLYGTPTNKNLHLVEHQDLTGRCDEFSKSAKLAILIIATHTLPGRSQRKISFGFYLTS